MNTKKKDSILDTLLSQMDEKSYKRTECKMIIATKIADALKERGMSQKDLAVSLGKKPSEISKWLSGTHNFTIDTLSDIECVLGIQLLNDDNLYNGDTQEQVKYVPLIVHSIPVEEKGNIYKSSFDLKVSNYDFFHSGEC